MNTSNHGADQLASRGLLRTALVAALLAAAPAVAHEPAPNPTPFLPIVGEPAPKLTVDPPMAGPLADRGAVIVPYRVENFRVLPIFGAGANDVSPRAGHLHVTVDDQPWHWADASGTDTVVVVGLPHGPHRILIEIATPDHKVIAGERIDFVVPRTKPGHAH